MRNQDMERALQLAIIVFAALAVVDEQSLGPSQRFRITLTILAGVHRLSTFLLNRAHPEVGQNAA
jgi:hypothetical protein